MLELTDRDPDIDVQEGEYKRLLGLPADYELQGRTRELADWAREWYRENGRPWIYAREASLPAAADGSLVINGQKLTSRKLQEQFSETNVGSAMLVAVSAGPECEGKARELWKEEKPDEYFFLEIYGSAVVEHLIARASFRLCEWADQHGLAILPHYSPGYSGWNIADQNPLFEAVRPGAGGRFPGSLTVLPTGMLSPKKSLLAVFGVTRELEKVKELAGLVPCERCALTPCQYRRAPYRRPLSQAEDVRRLRPDTLARSDPPAAYTINQRALEKWSQERLEVVLGDDGTIEAQFRYDGTTCSDLGRPLEFRYHIRLGPASDGYPIRGARCAPAPGDEGHTSMCRFKEDPKTLMREIGAPPALLGRPLGDVFSWTRPYSPSGCYCDAVGRDHKWGLVLEVLHYALVSRA